MKPRCGIYQAATKVNEFSPVMFNIVEADVFICAEGNTRVDEKKMASQSLLYRGLNQWHDIRWILCELGRSVMFFCN